MLSLAQASASKPLPPKASQLNTFRWNHCDRAINMRLDNRASHRKPRALCRVSISTSLKLEHGHPTGLAILTSD